MQSSEAAPLLIPSGMSKPLQWNLRNEKRTIDHGPALVRIHQPTTLPRVESGDSRIDTGTPLTIGTPVAITPGRNGVINDVRIHSGALTDTKLRYPSAAPMAPTSDHIDRKSVV